MTSIPNLIKTGLKYDYRTSAEMAARGVVVIVDERGHDVEYAPATDPVRHIKKKIADEQIYAYRAWAQSH